MCVSRVAGSLVCYKFEHVYSHSKATMIDIKKFKVKRLNDWRRVRMIVYTSKGSFCIEMCVFVRVL